MTSLLCQLSHNNELVLSMGNIIHLISGKICSRSMQITTSTFYCNLHLSSISRSLHWCSAVKSNSAKLPQCTNAECDKHWPCSSDDASEVLYVFMTSSVQTGIDGGPTELGPWSCSNKQSIVYEVKLSMLQWHDCWQTVYRVSPSEPCNFIKKLALFELMWVSAIS